MKRLLLIIGCCMAAVVATAQETLPGGTESIEARFSRLGKAYAKSPDDVEVLYNLALFYFDNSNPMRNLPVAMEYIMTAEKRHIWLLENGKNSELRRLLRNDITIVTIRQLEQAILSAAHNTVEARTDMTRGEIDSYLRTFSFDAELVSLLRQRRIDCIYEEDLKKATAESYYHYIDLFPGTRESELMESRLSHLAPGLFKDVASEEEAAAVAARFPLSPSVQRAFQNKKSSMVFAAVEKENTLAAYKEFLDRYPSSNESQQARDRIDGILEILYSECKTAMDYAVFANTYPDFSMADQALQQTRRLIVERHDVAAARYYLQHFKFDPSYHEIYKRYYSWHTAEGNEDPINRFVAENPEYPYPRIVEDDQRSAAYIDRVNLLPDFFETEFGRYADYVRRMTGKGIAIVPLKRMIQELVDSRNYKAALERVRQFDLSFEDVPEYRELQSILAAPASGSKAVREFAEIYSVMNPVVNESDGRLYYTRVAGKNRRICYAIKDGRQWLQAGEAPFDGPILNDGLTLFGFYGGGTHMLLGAEGNIMMAERENGIWRVTDIPPYPVNTDYIETDAYMLPDGSGLLLASDRPGGHNLQASGAYFHGDTAMASDLYFIPYEGGSWGTAINLGNTVNTPFCERSPILSRNLQTLYFITDGHGGLGFGDVYVSTRSNPMDWTSWSTPKNLGKEINTGHNETGLSFSPDEKTVYMSVNSKLGSYSCWSFPTAHSTASSVVSLALDLLGMENALLRVHVADMEQQSVTQVVECPDGETSLSLNVCKGRRYAVVGDAGLRFVPAVVFVAGAKDRLGIRGYSFGDLVKMERSLPLDAVDFDTLSSVLTPVAQMQLSQLARFLLRNPTAIAEFCIDVAGMDDRQCYNRSVQQGEAIRKFMNYNGIDTTRILLSPYGNVNVKRQGHSGVSVRLRENKTE